MSRTPGAPRTLVLPRPSEKYDAADQVETRRLIEQNARLLNDYSTLISIPKPVSALGSLTGAADMVPYFTSASVMALASLTPYARTIIACANAAAMRTVLGLGPLAILIPPTDATKFLNGAASPAWAAVKDSDLSLSNITTNDVTSTQHGFTPKSLADPTKFLNSAATPAYAQVKDSDLALTNVTTNDVSVAKHGFAPILPNDATKFLNGVGAYVVPSGGTPFPSTLPAFPALASTIQGRFSAEPTVSTLTLNTDGRCAQLNDASGNWGSNLTATTTARPRWLKRAMNGSRPGLVFDGITAKMTAGATKAIAQPLTVVAVVQNWRGGAANGNLFRDSAGGPVTFLNAGNSWAIFAGSGVTSTALFDQNQLMLPDGMVGSPAIIISVFNNASSIISNNGVEVTGTAGATGISGTMKIGGDNTTSFAHMILYEILFISGALSPTDRAAINTYYATALDINL